MTRPALIRGVSLGFGAEKWPLSAPFHIAGYTFEHIDVLVVTLEKDGYRGMGEAAGVYYRGDDVPSMTEQVRTLRSEIELSVSRSSLQSILPPGGARNALDCALWDLEAKLRGEPAWQMAEVESPRPLLTTFTCGAAKPEDMAAVARHYVDARALKLKLTGEPIDAERVRAVREARADIWLGVDANQGFTPRSLERLMPVLRQANVKLIEQPFRRGQEALLDGLNSPIPVAADESVQCRADIEGLKGRFDVINIKLDKCGGLTEALAMEREAREFGLDTMVGNMMGTSLAMAPAFLVGQRCTIVDLDGPIFLSSDRPDAVQYSDGMVTCPEALWGSRS